MENEKLEKLLKEYKALDENEKNAFKKEAYKIAPPKLIQSPDVVADFLKVEIGNDEKENFYVFYLDHDSRVLGHEKLFIGGSGKVSFDKKIIVKKAIEMNAEQLLTAHNHPNYDKPVASNADILITQSLTACLEIFGIKHFDSIIVSKSDEWFSFRENSMIENQVMNKTILKAFDSTVNNIDTVKILKEIKAKEKGQ